LSALIHSGSSPNALNAAVAASRTRVGQQIDERAVGILLVLHGHPVTDAGDAMLLEEADRVIAEPGIERVQTAFRAV